MAKKIEARIADKQAQLVSRTARALQLSEEETTILLRLGRTQSVRVNTLRGNQQETLTQLSKLGWQGTAYAWCDTGYTVEGSIELLSHSQLSDDGSIYIQNAASWLPVLALDPKPGDSVLDMCAAPGGKTTHLAQLSNNQAQITANDNSRPRLLKLQRTIARMGAMNVTCTLYDATRLARALDSKQFDKILLDAPCSGEGMMKLDNTKDFAYWSVAHIRRLQQLQKKLISEAWKLLKPGGTLVYSTCTIAPEENEAVIDYLLRRNPDAQVAPIPFATSLANRAVSVGSWNEKAYDPRILEAVRLAPSRQLEAFFVCKLTKAFYDQPGA